MGIVKNVAWPLLGVICVTAMVLTLVVHLVTGWMESLSMLLAKLAVPLVDVLREVIVSASQQFVRVHQASTVWEYVVVVQFAISVIFVAVTAVHVSKQSVQVSTVRVLAEDW
jgi:hypothetical protein